jgi:hypothetical protein
MLTQAGREKSEKGCRVTVLGAVEQKLEAVVDCVDPVGGKLADSVG